MKDFHYHVFCIKKALYGLKQALVHGFKDLAHSYLVWSSSVVMVTHPCFFFLKHNSNLLYHLVYVDDIILTDKNIALIHTFINRLNNEFATKDLGKLSYFLGYEVSYTDNGLF